MPRHLCQIMNPEMTALFYSVPQQEDPVQTTSWRGESLGGSSRNNRTMCAVQMMSMPQGSLTRRGTKDAATLVTEEASRQTAQQTDQQPDQRPVQQTAQPTLIGRRNHLPPEEMQRRITSGCCTYCGQTGHSRRACALGRLLRKVPRSTLALRIQQHVCPVCGDPGGDGHAKLQCPSKLALEAELVAKNKNKGEGMGMSKGRKEENEEEQDGKNKMRGTWGGFGIGNNAGDSDRGFWKEPEYVRNKAIHIQQWIDGCCLSCRAGEDVKDGKDNKESKESKGNMESTKGDKVTTGIEWCSELGAEDESDWKEWMRMPAWEDFSFLLPSACPSPLERPLAQVPPHGEKVSCSFAHPSLLSSLSFSPPVAALAPRTEKEQEKDEVLLIDLSD